MQLTWNQTDLESNMNLTSDLYLADLVPDSRTFWRCSGDLGLRTGLKVVH